MLLHISKQDRHDTPSKINITRTAQHDPEQTRPAETSNCETRAMKKQVVIRPIWTADNPNSRDRNGAGMANAGTKNVQAAIEYQRNAPSRTGRRLAADAAVCQVITRCCQSSTCTDLTWVKLRSSSRSSSRPTPLDFIPPNGIPQKCRDEPLSQT